MFKFDSHLFDTATNRLKKALSEIALPSPKKQEAYIKIYQSFEKQLDAFLGPGHTPHPGRLYGILNHSSDALIKLVQSAPDSTTIVATIIKAIDNFSIEYNATCVNRMSELETYNEPSKELYTCMNRMNEYLRHLRDQQGPIPTPEYIARYSDWKRAIGHAASTGNTIPSDIPKNRFFGNNSYQNLYVDFVTAMRYLSTVSIRATIASLEPLEFLIGTAPAKDAEPEPEAANAPPEDHPIPWASAPPDEDEHAADKTADEPTTAQPTTAQPTTAQPTITVEVPPLPDYGAAPPDIAPALNAMAAAGGAWAFFEPQLTVESAAVPTAATMAFASHEVQALQNQRVPG